VRIVRALRRAFLGRLLEPVDAVFLNRELEAGAALGEADARYGADNPTTVELARERAAWRAARQVLRDFANGWRP
jgi:hypothetical protein